MKNSVCTLFLAGAVSAALSPMMAQAQSAESTSTTKVEEIVVTAQRRSERLQDVPVAVTAVKGEQLEALGVQSALDLKAAAPSLNTGAANGFFTSSIRGVGSVNYAPGVESPVALYIDGAYLAAPQASELALNNVQSVEVLKGPQGTLFGRNATGGLIQITTATPSSEPEGKFSVGYGNYDTFTGSGYIGGPLAEGLAADLAFSGRTRKDGYGNNIVTGTDVGEIERDIAVRSKVVWAPGEDTTVTLIGNYWKGEDSTGAIVAFPNKVSGFVNTATGFAENRVNPDLDYDSDSNVDFNKRGRTWGGSLKVDHDMSAMRFSSITAYRTGTFHLYEDLDFTPFDVTDLVSRQRDRQFSQELQLSSLGDSRLKWTTGLFYFYLKSGYEPIFLDFTNYPFVGAALDLTGIQSGKSIAGYAQATYELFEDTNLTLGGRYTRERRKELSPELIVIPPVIGPLPPVNFGTRSDTASKFTYRVSLDHRFTDGLMGYVSVNTGFKSGGYNSNEPGTKPYKPETLDAYEIGLKTDLFDQRLRLNFAGFYYDYTNIQVQRIATTALVIENGPSARIYGVDVDFTAILSDAFSLTGGINWISPTFGSFPDCPISQPVGGIPLVQTGTSCKDNQIPLAAKFSGSLAANYSAKVGMGALQASVSVYNNSGYFFESDNVLDQGSYAKLGSTIKWTSDSGFSVGAFGKNLTDKRTRTFAATQAGGNAVVAYDEPRTYGVTFGYEF